MKTGKIQSLIKGKGLLQNSFWGVLANILQNLFLGLFFILLARSYSVEDFADYLVANTLYQLVASFSTMGLGQWFTREIVNTEDKQSLISRFLKLQIYFGVFFYLVNCGLTLLLYSDELIIRLSLYVGVNILFDNFIYALRSLNIAENKQKHSFLILLIESSIKLVVGGILVLQSVSIEMFTLLSVLLRIVTLNLFLRMSSSNLVNLKSVMAAKITWEHVKCIVLANWVFVVIGSVSVIYWRISNIIISKMLTSYDVANFEICFKLFSIAQIIPVIFSATVFPKLVRLANEKKFDELRRFYSLVYYGYLIFSLLCYTFIYSFGDTLMPWMFGDKFVGLADSLNKMFLTILIFPTALLQANLLVAVKMEKYDMIYNVISLLSNLILSFLFLYFNKELSAVNISIFISFLLFHILQDFSLLKRKFISIQKVLIFYVSISLTVLFFFILGNYLNLPLLFILFWIALAIAAVVVLRVREMRFADVKKLIVGLNG